MPCCSARSCSTSRATSASSTQRANSQTDTSPITRCGRPTRESHVCGELVVVIEIRTKAEVEEMRPAGAFVSSVVAATFDAAKVGVNILDLDRLAGEMIRKAGAISSYVDYHPSFGGSKFGKFICISVNDAALHGLPHDYKLQDGDVVSLDFAASLNGWVADSARTVIVGTPRPEDERLVDVTRRALDAAIAQAVPGNKMGDISAAIGAVAHAAGLKVNLEFGGHGVGREMHGDP